MATSNPESVSRKRQQQEAGTAAGPAGITAGCGSPRQSSARGRRWYP